MFFKTRKLNADLKLAAQALIVLDSELASATAGTTEYSDIWTQRSRVVTMIAGLTR